MDHSVYLPNSDIKRKYDWVVCTSSPYKNANTLREDQITIPVFLRLEKELKF